jgi:molybdenum cofactor guanylyltransferase
MGTNKALVVVAGMPMASRVADALRYVGCDPLVLIGGDEGVLCSLGERFVGDDHPGEGPLGAIATALRWARAHADLLLVASCDLGHVRGAALAGLADRARNSASSDEIDVFVARSDRIEPLCAVWRTSALASVDQAFDSGERSVLRALAGMRVEEVPVDPGSLRNINTPHDLDQ